MKVGDAYKIDSYYLENYAQSRSILEIYGKSQLRLAFGITQHGFLPLPNSQRVL